MDAKNAFINNFVTYFIKTRLSFLISNPYLRIIISELSGIKEPDHGLLCINNFFKLLFTRRGQLPEMMDIEGEREGGDLRIGSSNFEDSFAEYVDSKLELSEVLTPMKWEIIRRCDCQHNDSIKD